jgi:hypothetical protein
MNPLPLDYYRDFPHLETLPHSVTSPVARSYNCIAWAAEQDDSFWWPGRNNYGYWPPGVEREETLAAFIAAFETLGYAPCDSSLPEDEVEKIAIYTDGAMPTHAARQLADGTWTSKLGQAEDICHQTLDALAGGLYGNVAQIMSRRVRG